MLNHLVLAEVKNAMLGNIILVSGSILTFAILVETLCMGMPLVA